MSSAPLGGEKVAVLVESEYIPYEIRAYREQFAALGAEVHFIARLWGQPKQTFVSDVDTPLGTLEETQKKLEWMDVDIDLTKTDPSRYDAVIMCANYTSVRSRYFEAPEGSPVNPIAGSNITGSTVGWRSPRSLQGSSGFFPFLIDFCKPLLCYGQRFNS